MNGNALGLVEERRAGRVDLCAGMRCSRRRARSTVIKLDGGVVSAMVLGDEKSARAAVEAGAQVPVERGAAGGPRNPAAQSERYSLRLRW